jgi:flagellar motor switch protein FliN
MADTDDIPLPNLKGDGGFDLGFVEAGNTRPDDEIVTGKVAQDLEHVFDVPVNVSAVLGRTRLEIGELLRLGPGTVLELDRRVGEAIDIFVNDRLVARGEVVLVEDRLGVTMTEIIKADR